MRTVTHSQFLGLVYHSLFNYPLTAQELAFWQIGLREHPRHRVEKKGPFYFLAGEDHAALLRRSAAFYKKKWRIAKRAARLLARIPTVSFVGATGSLAMQASGKDEDVDLVIVTSVDSLWITRIVAYLFLRLVGIPVRRPGDKLIKDKLCLNLWLDEANLSFASKDIYTAHEILQIVPLTGKKGFRQLLKSNAWALQFFPNARREFKAASTSPWQGLLGRSAKIIARFLNPPAYLVQRRYMSSRISKEVVTRGKALFHPQDWSSFVPQVFLARLERLSKARPSSSYTQVSD